MPLTESPYLRLKFFPRVSGYKYWEKIRDEVNSQPYSIIIGFRPAHIMG